MARSATSPSFAYVSDPVPDSSLCRGCCSLIVSTSAVALREITARSASTGACSPFASASAAACVRFSCCSPIASVSAAAPRLRPLWLLLPDCVRFGCCSPIASASAAAPRLCPLQLLLPDCIQLEVQLQLPNCIRFDPASCSGDSSPCSHAPCSRTFFAEFVN